MKLYPSAALLQVLHVIQSNITRKDSYTIAERVLSDQTSQGQRTHQVEETHPWTLVERHSCPVVRTNRWHLCSGAARLWATLCQYLADSDLSSWLCLKSDVEGCLCTEARRGIPSNHNNLWQSLACNISRSASPPPPEFHCDTFECRHSQALYICLLITKHLQLQNHFFHDLSASLGKIQVLFVYRAEKTVFLFENH